MPFGYITLCEQRLRRHPEDEMARFTTEVAPRLRLVGER
jgi:hypothetical protein